MAVLDIARVFEGVATLDDGFGELPSRAQREAQAL